jgi:Ran GTPase-activating protein (RanGAP) involved in mRNA processing and transport
MEDDMIDVSAGNEQPSGNGNGSRSMEDSMVSKLDGGSVKGEGFRSNKRPTRESVLKRLSEALMRRTLTKIDLSQRGLVPSDARLVKMALFQNSNLSVLKLGYNNLGDEGIETLAAGIAAHKALASLDLGFNNVGDQGCRALSTALISSSCSSGSLHTLYLAGNVFGEDGARAISDVIRNGPSIKRLHLTGNRIGPDGVKAIAEAVMGGGESSMDQDDSLDVEMHPPLDTLSLDLPAGVQELFLAGTGMGPSGSVSVARMLETSKTMRIISLANCDIGDTELKTLAASIKNNRETLPLEALHLSFNKITCKGLDSLMNAIWGSHTIRELLLDNNKLGDRGAEQVAAILPNIKTLEVLDVGFNSIKSGGMRTLMRVVAETHHLVSLSVSGNPIDTAAAKLVAYALAYNRSLRSMSLVHCSIEHEGQRHIAAGIVSNRGIALRKLTGFSLGPIIVTIKFPPAMERWTNEQILSFLHLMWENSSQGPEKDPQDKAIDPLHFLPPTNGEPPKKKGDGPLDAKIVVEVAKRAFESFRESGPELLTPPSGASYYEACFGSPLADNAIVSEGSEWPVSTETAAFAGGDGSDHSVMSLHSGSFVAAPSSAPDSSVPDPGRKKRIVDWLCKNMQQINELSQKPFDSAELWKLHQHYFAPVVIEKGGNVPASPSPSLHSVSRIVSSVPDVSRQNPTPEPSTITPSTLSSDEHMFVASSEPSLLGSPPAASLPMLKRKVSYRFLGDATITSSRGRSEARAQSMNNPSVSQLIQNGGVGHSMPPKSKRARRNKTRISFLPRIKNKLDNFLDTDHEKALVMMRQLYYVEKALLKNQINPSPSNLEPCTHLCGVLSEEAQMILLDMI